MQNYTFSFAKFEKIGLKFETHLDWKDLDNVNPFKDIMNLFLSLSVKQRGVAEWGRRSSLVSKRKAAVGINLCCSVPSSSFPLNPTLVLN